MTYYVQPNGAQGNPGPTPSGGIALWFQTIAAMAAAPGPPTREVTIQVETAAQYEFYPGDATTPDNWRVVASTSGVAGNWILIGPRISLVPLGGGADDWVRLYSALHAMSGLGRVEMGAGTWLAKTDDLLLPLTGVELYLDRGTRIVETLTPGNPVHAAFAATMLVLAATTVAAPNVIGSRAISSTASVAAGSYIYIQDGTSVARAALYLVESVAGAGPFTLTVERPVMWQFAAGDVLRRVVPPRNIRIYGNGATITGTGDRYIEIQGGIDCYVENINLDDSAGAADSYWFSWDANCQNCDAVGIRATGAGTNTGATLNIETGEGTFFTRCVVNGNKAIALSAGYAIWDSFRCALIACQATQCNIGAIIGAQDVTNLGSLESWIDGGFYNGNVTMGVFVGFGSVESLVANVTASFNGTNGIELFPTTGANVAPSRTRLVNVHAHGNVLQGLYLGTGSTDVQMDGADFSGNQSYGMICNATNLDATQLQSVDTVAGGNPNGVCYFGIGTHRVSGFHFEMKDPGLILVDVDTGVTAEFVDGIAKGPGSCLVFHNNGVRMTVQNVRIDFASTLNVAISHPSADAGSVTILRDVRTTGGGGGSKGYVGAAGCTLREYGVTNFDSTATPYTINAAGYANKFGFVTLGAAPVVVPWPSLNGGDRIVFTQFGGTPTSPIVSAYNPGTGFTMAAGTVGAQFTWVIGP